MTINDYARLLGDLGAESISLFWMPIGIWTVLALGYLLFLRQKAGMPPQAHYQMLTALILALPLGALLAFLAPLSISAPEVLQFAPPATDLASAPLPAPTDIPEAGFVFGFFHVLGLITLALLLVSILKVAQLITETIRFRHMTAVLSGQPLEAVSPKLEAIRKEWGIRDVEVFFSDEDHVPMTFGWRKALVVIPRSLQGNADELHMTLIHELAHIRNADFLRQWIERIIASFYFFHPLVHTIADQIDQSREMNCDVEVLSQQDVSPEKLRLPAPQLRKPTAGPADALYQHVGYQQQPEKQDCRHEGFPDVFQESACNPAGAPWASQALLLVSSALIVACEVKFQTDNSITIIEAPENQSATTA